MEDVREDREEGAVEPRETVEAPPEAAEAAAETPESARPEQAEEAAVEPEQTEETAAETEQAEEPAAEKEPEKDDRFQWFVVHTYAGHEERVSKNIERAVTQAGLKEKVKRVLVPTESVAEMKNGKKTISDKKFFPSYVLVEMEMEDETWRVVMNTPGVTRFVGVGAEPQPISGEEIDLILGRIEGTREKPTPTVPFHVGEHVKVSDGPFTDFTGVVDEINPERGKLKVMVTIFGRATPVELDFLQVKSL
ncbi:MAG: transcription termination/antitermination factor NusG [Candidatus Eisenbacteria bacterium]|nr:transcription termination/antitermination factor NusG [Candidatus Eisenbacteria bacterium]